ncbi:hypothetical protein Hypma_001143 [Hypsizygus marmoreus]|uniref:Uncharacterized protein n=1 Tax=Hypsizygus marmoreus TaxID=39966 RepID=A0A369JCX5_HYPMA|nr:hypothetical protein Hypma_001143 [Hypsizygus marmoreus]
MVTVTISSASKPPSFARGLPINIECKPTTTISDVKASIVVKFPKFYPSRQKISLTNDRANLNDEKALQEIFGENFEGRELQVKDLGPQVAWRTVFLVEYCGPLIIHPLIYHFPRIWYGQDVAHSDLQKFVYAFVLLHFLKRELETIFVHRFSHGTMPFRNIFKNSAHYHLLSGLALAYDVYRPKFASTSSYITGTIRDDKTFLWVCAGLWTFAELSNLHTHLTLRSLRPFDTRTRAIPYGYGFTYVSAPNYFFETIAWLVICVMTGSVAAAVFTIVAGIQMTLWAVKKHRAYKKEFGKAYPRNRKAMFPFVLPSNMDTRLFDARFWPILVNVTDDPTYRPLIVLIDNLREALELKNLPHGPFIDLLLALYKDEGSAGDKVVDLRPELPTDDDIMDFFRSHWPVLIFTRPREGAPFTWRSIGTSELMEYDRFVDSQSVPILGLLVDHWQELSLSGTTEGQAPLEAVAVLILGVLLHELGTGILAWWVRDSRDVDVVKLGGILGDAGSFVENQIFGGSLEGWWGKDGTVGNLLEMECVVVVTADERIRKIDKDIATRIFSCLTGRLTIPAVDFSSDTSDLIPPSTAAQYRRVRMTTFLDRGDSATQ